MSPMVLVRGSGDVGSAVAVVLPPAGYGGAVPEVAAPSAPRRGMAFADAVFDGECVLDGVLARRVQLSALPDAVADGVAVAVLCGRSMDDLLAAVAFDVVVDARMRKRERPERQV